MGVHMFAGDVLPAIAFISTDSEQWDLLLAWPAVG